MKTYPYKAGRPSHWEQAIEFRAANLTNAVQRAAHELLGAPRNGRGVTWNNNPQGSDVFQVIKSVRVPGVHWCADVLGNVIVREVSR